MNAAIFLSILTPLVIAMQAWIYHRQLREMRKSAQAATDASNAAKQGLEFARENSAIDQRAWVTAIEIRLKNGIEPRPEVCIQILNSGKTQLWT